MPVVTVTLSTTLECTADEAFARVRTWPLLAHVAAPLIRFTPKDNIAFPDQWQPGEYRAWMWLFGIVPLGWQAVVISEPPPDGATRFIRDNGYSPLIKRFARVFYAHRQRRWRALARSGFAGLAG